MRRTITAVTAALIIAGTGACGSDDSTPNDGGGGQSDAPVNTDTPAQSGDTTPAPNQSKRGDDQ
jgi:hypothetical protein